GDVTFKGESGVSVAMEHVREGIPDVQRRRHEVSAALAGVLERATAKERQNRYRSMADFVGDLEEVLTYETARAGEATGEATAVLSALPANVARQKRGWRRLLPWGAYILIAGAVAGGAVVVIGGNDTSTKGIDVSGLSTIPLSESA